MKSVLGNRMLLWSLVIPLLSVLLALATAGILLYSSGANPIDAYSSMVRAALGSPFALSTTVIKALPRLLPAGGIAVALRAGLWNIGAEGQLYIGALAATGTALFGPHLGFPGSAALALVAAMLGGAAWAAIAGALRAVKGISEVITSLMLVYVAIQLTNYLVEGPWLVPHSTFPATSPVPIDARLPNIWPGTMLNAGVFVAVVVVAASWFVIARTSFGLKIRAIGGNPRAARVAG
ncbi:MAG: ral nucleoside transport system permease protein, partial [Pseudonocardiales bacterium]|nr:ral nucleoside transport system permease protein [Pseudonocardiales bacterium]